MKLENVAFDGQQVKDGIADAVEKIKEFPAEIKKSVDEAYKTVAKGVRRTQVAAEEAADDARRGIKARPLTSVTTAAFAGIGVGVLVGWLIARGRR